MLIIITMGGHIENVTIVTFDMVVVHCTHVWLALLSRNEPKEVISTICLYSFILSEQRIISLLYNALYICI